MTTYRNQTDVYLKKCRKVILPEGHGGASTAVVSTAARNLQTLGFGLSTSVLSRLKNLRESQVLEWYQSVMPTLQQMVGAHRVFNPMYPNFPKQVMEASEAELFFNAMTHYFGFVLSDMLGDPNLVILPNYEQEARPKLEEFHGLRWIELGSEEDFDAIFTRLAASNGSLSEDDKDVLRWFANERDVDKLMPEKIPQKENLAFIVSVLPNPDSLKSAIKTATDVLRIAVAMSVGDVSLAEATKFRNFSKRERRFLLSCMEQLGPNLIQDMLRWKSRWVRLGERLHPGDFQNRFPTACEAFGVLRDNKSHHTFNSSVEQSLTSGDVSSAIKLLVQRPGDFARRLDHVLRTFTEYDRVTDEFLRVAQKVSTPVLLQTWRHFQRRNKLAGRAFFPKGNAAKVQFKDDPLPPLPDDVTQSLTAGIYHVLIARFQNLPSLGKVFLDDRLKDQLVPFSQRSASRSLRSIVRGSKFDLPEGDTVRFFCWWKNLDDCEDDRGRVDLDLSASFFDADWEVRGGIAYYKLREGSCYHSGDITSAPRGACEFMDVNLSSVLEMGARYVVMSVLSYTQQPFIALPECFGGWMMRREPNSGEVFEPQTVQDKIDITASTRSCVPLIIDAHARKAIWADLGLKTSAQINNAARNSVGFTQIGRALVSLNKPTLYDLFEMHALARGELVALADEADTVFGVEEGTVTAFSTGVILSEYLA